jgi:NTP pyrophosphatase (non-canonical NTP hydrolase)
MKELEQEIKEYLVERNWYGLEPADLAKSIMIEGAELLELFQWKDYSIEDINSDGKLKANLKKELADVMIYAIELGVHLDIDITEAIKQKLEHNRNKYPVEGVTNKDSGDDFYMKQKMKYRKNGE